MSNIIIQGNEINAKKYVDKITIDGIGEEKTLNPKIVVADNNANNKNVSIARLLDYKNVNAGHTLIEYQLTKKCYYFLFIRAIGTLSRPSYLETNCEYSRYISNHVGDGNDLEAYIIKGKSDGYLNLDLNMDATYSNNDCTPVMLIESDYNLIYQDSMAFVNSQSNQSYSISIDPNYSYIFVGNSSSNMNNSSRISSFKMNNKELSISDKSFVQNSKNYEYVFSLINAGVSSITGTLYAAAWCTSGFFVFKIDN